MGSSGTPERLAASFLRREKQGARHHRKEPRTVPIEEQKGPNGFARKVLVAVSILLGVVVFVVLVWRLASVLALVFAGILLTLAINGICDALRRRLPMPRAAAVLALLVVLLGVVACLGWFIGPDLAAQFQRLEKELPAALSSVQKWMSQHELGRRVLDNLPVGDSEGGGETDLFGQLAGFFSSFFGFVTAAVVVITVGFYAAFQPELYVNAALRLVPPPKRARGREILEALAHVLRRWLLGRFAAMGVIGVLTTTALALVGTPLSLSLGLIAGTLSFIPFIGPVASAIPAVLMGFLNGPAGALKVALAFLVVQTLESNLITPLIEKRAVSMPPALVIAVQFVMGSLLGLLGIFIATPVAVVVTVLVQMVYIEDVLGDRVTVLGR
jgi:predicted PurR-regulated permease PerM